MLQTIMMVVVDVSVVVVRINANKVDHAKADAAFSLDGVGQSANRAGRSLKDHRLER